MLTCLLNLEDDLANLHLEHQYNTNSSRHLYPSCRFLFPDAM